MGLELICNLRLGVAFGVGMGWNDLIWLKWNSLWKSNGGSQSVSIMYCLDNQIDQI